jgi:hypothetical protein
MSSQKVKEYVEIEGNRVAVTAENLIKAHKKMWQMQEELDSLRDSVYHLEHRLDQTYSI